MDATPASHRSGAQPRRADAGFTLVELLIVIVILGVLAAVTVLVVRGITDRGQETSEAADLDTLVKANEAYWIEHGTNATEQQLVDAGLIGSLSSIHDLSVDGSGALTIVNTRTGSVAGTAAGGAGGGGGGGGGGDGGDGGGGGGSPVGSVGGLVTNASTEVPIAGAQVCVSAIASCETTDATGAYSIEDVPVGEQTVAFTASGFTAVDQTVTVEEDLVTTQHMAMSRQLAPGDVRIVLSWEANPSDLDLHLHVPGDGHVRWDGKGTLGSFPFAQLDVDDVDGFGPETITISQLLPGTYSVAVEAIGSGFVPEETVVRVYDSTGLLREVSPPSGSGRWWRVLRLDGSSGGITIVNTRGSVSGPF